MTGGSVATIFVRDGDNFVRVSTSLKKKMVRGQWVRIWM